MVGSFQVKEGYAVLAVRIPIQDFEYRDVDKDGKARKTPILTSKAQNFEHTGVMELGHENGKFATRAQCSFSINLSGLKEQITETDIESSVSDLDAAIARLQEKRQSLAASLPTVKAGAMKGTK